MDISGPLPTTSRGNQFICVVMDYFTKWPEAYALPNHEAETVADVLVSQFFTRFGVPDELHSDQGREFESRIFQESCELLGLRKTRTMPHRPQSDGMVERFNRTLANELAKYCGEGQQDWDLKLPALLMAYRSAVHEATDYTPARLMLGRELRLLVDLATGQPPDQNLPTDTTTYALVLRERLSEVHRQVRGSLRIAGQAIKQHYDRRMREARYAVGDLVWLHNPRRKKGLSPKLQSPWEGPYSVVEVISSITYRIRKGQRGRTLVVHVDRLWCYHGPGNYTWGHGEADDTGDEDQPDERERSMDHQRDQPPADVDLSGREQEEATVMSAPSSPLLAADPRGAIPKRRRQRPKWLQDYYVPSESSDEE